MKKPLLALALLLAPLAADAQGLSTYFLPEACRFVDTRAPRTTPPGLDPKPYSPPGVMHAGYVFFTVRGFCQVPADAKAVILNLTATGATAAGHLTLWPYSADALNPPGTSNLNFATGVAAANQAQVALADTVGIDLAAWVTIPEGESVHLVVDVVAYMK